VVQNINLGALVVQNINLGALVVQIKKVLVV
jgi:hypothetical protein